MKRIELIEFLKGYSILTIVIFHYLQTFHWQNLAGKLIFFGGTGVHLFILLSGFGLYFSYLHKPIPFSKFLKKRISKVYVPYIIIVLISAFITMFIPIYKGSLYALFGHIFLYKMFDESIIGSYGYPLWFISMIIQFYLMFYPILWIKNKMKLNFFLIISFVISIIWIIFIILSGKDEFRIWNSFFLKYLWEFNLGIYLAQKFKENNYKLNFRLNKWKILIIGISSCLLYAILALKVGTVGKMVNDFPALLGYSFIAIWIYQIRLRFINQFVFYISKISYSLYLLHTLIIMLVKYYFVNVWHPIILFISFILSIIISKLYQNATNSLYRT